MLSKLTRLKKVKTLEHRWWILQEETETAGISLPEILWVSRSVLHRIISKKIYFLLLALLFCHVPANAERKLVTALYHGVRHTREHDGKSWGWSDFRACPKSKAAVKARAWNADIIDENGKRNVACFFGEPIVGIQSEMDPDYHEYQILLAKLAGIDGFIVDFHFFGRNLDIMRLKMQKTARKYNFKISVDWGEFYPRNADTREKQLASIYENIEYLRRHLFSQKECLKWNSRPVVFVFGGPRGFSPKEIKEFIKLTGAYALRRYAPQAKIIDDKYTWKGKVSLDSWIYKNTYSGTFNWVTPRVREFEKGHDFDQFATPEDCLNDLRTYITLLKDSRQKLRELTILPGFDNRGCMGWGRRLAWIDREAGNLYTKSWQLAVANRKDIDIIMIATWNDFTEGSQIEPTGTLGYREIKTTAKFSRKFKNEKVPEDIIQMLPLPARLLAFRKKKMFYEELGFNTNALSQTLDKLGMAISEFKIQDAASLVRKAEEISSKFDTMTELETVTIKVPGKDCSVSGLEGQVFNLSKAKAEIKLSEKFSERLRRECFSANISLEYLDQGKVPETLFKIYTTPPQDKKTFNCIAAVGSNNSGKYIKAKFNFFKKNMLCSNKHSKARTVFSFSGKTIIKNITLNFIFYKKRQ